MNHKAKLKLARSLLAPAEKKGATIVFNGRRQKVHTSPFGSASWNVRRAARIARAAKQQSLAHKRAIERHALSK